MLTQVKKKKLRKNKKYEISGETETLTRYQMTKKLVPIFLGIIIVIRLHLKRVPIVWRYILE